MTLFPGCKKSTILFEMNRKSIRNILYWYSFMLRWGVGCLQRWNSACNFSSPSYRRRPEDKVTPSKEYLKKKLQELENGEFRETMAEVVSKDEVDPGDASHFRFKGCLSVKRGPWGLVKILRSTEDSVKEG